MRRLRSSSPTERSDDANKLRMVRRLGSAMIANDDSMTFIYRHGHILVKSCTSSNPEFMPEKTALQPSRVATSSLSSSMRFEKPHSLSYQAKTLAKRSPMI